MKKLMLATTIALLVGATASPAFAQDGGRRAGGEYAETAAAEPAAKGPAQEERQEARDDRREQRDDQREARDDRREARDDQRDARADYRGDNRQGSRSWTPGNADAPGRMPRDHAGVAVPGGYRQPAQARSPSLADQVAAQQRYRDASRDGNRYRDDDRDDERDDRRDGNRYGDNDRYRDANRYTQRDYDRNRSYDWRNDWRNDRHDWRADQRRSGNYYTRYADSRWNGYQWYPQYRYRAPTRYVRPYGFQSQRWSVGYRMPYGYYNSPSYIMDWRYYRLPMPPMGFEWVRVDRDVVLVHMMSGYVRDVLYGLFY